MIQTVTGTISPENLGITLLHEHVICGSPIFFRGFAEKWMDREEVITNVITQIKEAVRCYSVSTIVDGSPFSLSRDIGLLKEISERSGVNIIASTGYYTNIDYGIHEIPAEVQAKYFIDECCNGIEGTAIRPGFLKCATDATTSLHPIKIIALIQKETNLPLFAHSDAKAKTGLKQLEIFEQHKLDMGKVVIGHVGDTHDLTYVEELLKHGCYVCIDRLYEQNDIAAKARMIVELTERGWGNKITTAHDHICWKMKRNLKQQKNSPKKLAEETVLNNIGTQLIPELVNIGFSRQQVDELLIRNPRKIFE